MTSPLDRLARLLADRYRIERELGHGGMATVYLAHDVRHDRKVAIKVLHAELAAALGVERFLAEIRVTANLQHPNILPLLDSGLLEEGAIPFYVMPFAEGDSLRQRLDREQQLPIGDAISIAKGVAAALGYAHKHGVVHRDIKPENILLQDGQPVVADFGIALAVTAAGGQRLTATGLSLGTPHYMSPEQAMGERNVDARADVYALGVVTYEMLVGETPFTGPNSSAVVAKVLTERPASIATRRDTVPPHIDAAVQQALQKLPADRFASAADFAAALSTPSVATPVPVSSAPSTVAPRARSTPRAALPWLVTAAALVVAGWALRNRAPLVEREQWDLVAPDSAPIISDEGSKAYSAPAISLDGTLLVYTARTDSSTMLYVAKLGAVGPRALPETRGGYAPFFSPDGRRVGFLAPHQIRIVDVATGKVSVVHEGIDALMGTWTSAGQIAFLDDAGYGWVDADGAGRVERIAVRPRADVMRAWPGITALPGVNEVLISDFELRLAVVSLSDKSVRYLTLGEPSTTPPSLENALLGVWGRFVAPGYLVLWRPGAKLLAVRFDARSLRVSGKPVEIMRGVRVNVAGVSPSGTWAYPPVFAAGGSVIAELGAAGLMRNYAFPLRRYQGMSLSPDAKRVAVRIMSESGRFLVEAYGAGSDAALIARIDAPTDWTPQWDASSHYLFSATALGVVFRQDIRTNVQDSIVIPLTAGETFELDGVVGTDTLIATIGPTGQRDIFYVPLSDPKRRISLVVRQGDQFVATMSPSGRWVAYTSVDHGTPELLVESRRPGGQPLRVGERWSYVWDANDQLYYIAGGFVNRVRITAGPEGPTATPPARVASAALLGGDERKAFAPIRDGRSLIALVATFPSTANHFVVVRNWQAELQRLTK